MYGTSFSLLSFVIYCSERRLEKERERKEFCYEILRGDDSGEGGRRMTIVDGWEGFDGGYVGRDWIFGSLFSSPFL